MLIEILTPDQLLYKGEIDSVIFPGISGQFGVLNNHAPLISALKKGIISVKRNNEKDVEGSFAKEVKGKLDFNLPVNGGTVEVKDNKVLVLAE